MSVHINYPNFYTNVASLYKDTCDRLIDRDPSIKYDSTTIAKSIKQHNYILYAYAYDYTISLIIACNYIYYGNQVLLLFTPLMSTFLVFSKIIYNIILKFEDID